LRRAARDLLQARLVAREEREARRVIEEREELKWGRTLFF
jgi:hypothetical protein